MGDLIGAPAVHLNFPLLSFSLYTTFKKRIAAAREPTPLESGRFGEWLLAQTWSTALEPYCKIVYPSRADGDGHPEGEDGWYGG